MSENTVSSIGTMYNCGLIGTFKELMDVVMWDWEHSTKLIRLSTGELQINKTTIGKDFVDYKMEHYPLAEGLFEKLECFFALLEED